MQDFLTTLYNNTKAKPKVSEVGDNTLGRVAPHFLRPEVHEEEEEEGGPRSGSSVMRKL